MESDMEYAVIGITVAVIAVGALVYIKRKNPGRRLIDVLRGKDQ